MLFVQALGGMEALQPWALALVIGSARMFGIMLAFPAFTQAQLEGLIRFVMAIALSLPIAGSLFPELQSPASVGWLRLMVLIVKEVLVGIGVGMIMALPFWALQAAGDLIDQSRGASQANVSDPVNASETTVLGQALMIIALLLFAVSDGLLTLLSALYESYRAWPALSFAPPPGMDLVKGLGGFLGEVVRLGFILGMPLLLALFIVDLTLGFLGKMAQQLQLNDLGNSLKNLMVVLLFPFLMLFFVSYTLPQLRAIGVTLKRFMGVN